MMGGTNMDWVEMSDIAIVGHLGKFIKYTRIQQSITQAQLAEMAGLNRWTVGQIENGESITLTSLIQILRALDVLYVLDDFEVIDETGPIEYAKLQEKKRKRVRTKRVDNGQNEDVGW